MVPALERVWQKLTVGAVATAVGLAVYTRENTPTGADRVVTKDISSAEPATGQANKTISHKSFFIKILVSV